MSVWGGIGEGLAQGVKDRIALLENRRERDRQQANTDRQFKFSREQANRSQANADREFELKREAANNANEINRANIDLRKSELESKNEDRAFMRDYHAAMLEDKALDRKFRIDEANRSQANADREFGLKQQAADWQAQMNAEKLRGFQMANDQLDIELRKRREQDDIAKESGRNQLALAFGRLESGRGTEVTLPNGQKARSLGEDVTQRIFGADNKFFAGLTNVVAIDTPDGVQMGLVREDGTMQMFNEDNRYGIYRGVYGKDFADGMLANASERRDLGMLAKKTKITTDAAIRRDMARPSYANNTFMSTMLKQMENLDLTDEQREAISRAAYNTYMRTAGNSGEDIDDDLAAALAERERRMKKGPPKGPVSIRTATSK